MGKPRLPENSALLITSLILIRLWSVFSNLIYDCDETYNYWEVSHYLIFKNGYMTWEYSPKYALRSYFYLWIYIWPSFILSFITTNELILFYFTRVTIACFSIFCELYFCIGLSRCAGSSVSRYCMAFLLMSSGTYFASTAFLPNTFSMHMTMIVYGAWFCDQYKMTIFSAGLSVLVGWPYAALVYSAPIVVIMLFSRWRKQLYFFMFTLVYGLMILIPLILVDSYHYGKFVIAPLNAILYNVFNPNAGPELYGVEGPFYYMINLLLNFNLILLVSFLSPPLLILSNIFMSTKKHKMFETSHWICISSLFFWLLLFSLQSHKEERFMYPIYPLICATAAMTTKLIEQSVISKKQPYSTPVFKFIVLLGCLAFLGLSLSRVISVQSSFKATFNVFSDLKQADMDRSITPLLNNSSEALSEDKHINVCLGKEWYRYPSSFFLPDSRKYRLRFIKSDFSGQLPKLYEQESKSSKLKTNIVYEDFNNMNREEVSRYIPVNKCHYLIDSSPSSSSSTKQAGNLSHSINEPIYSDDTDTWQKLSSHKLLDLSKSPAILRSFHLPTISHKKNKYMDYNLLRNKKLFVGAHL